MTRNKTTKRSLLASALALLLCVAMLVGTTFAWFTDTVTSGKNTIVAGNLDVELEYKLAKYDPQTGKVSPEKGEDDDPNGGWKPVTAETDLFTAVKKTTEPGPNNTQVPRLWEPGHTEVVYLRVKNVGSLALQYDLSALAFSGTYDEEGKPIAEKKFTSKEVKKDAEGNVVKNTDGSDKHETFKLSEHIVFNAIKGVEAKSREDLWISNTGSLEKNKENEESLVGNLDDILASMGTEGNVLYPQPKGESAVEDPNKPSEAVFTLAAYMPTWVGNEANQWTEAIKDKFVNGQKIEGEGPATVFFGITLKAYQTPYEKDSFNDQYDLEAKPSNAVISAVKDGVVTMNMNMKAYAEMSDLKEQKDGSFASIVAIKNGEKIIQEFYMDILGPLAEAVKIKEDNIDTISIAFNGGKAVEVQKIEGEYTKDNLKKAVGTALLNGKINPVGKLSQLVGKSIDVTIDTVDGTSTLFKLNFKNVDTVTDDIVGSLSGNGEDGEDGEEKKPIELPININNAIVITPAADATGTVESTLNLNGKTIVAETPNDAYEGVEAKNTVLMVDGNVKLTIEGNGEIQGHAVNAEEDQYSRPVWTKNGAEVTINGGKYTGSPYLIYSQKGDITINGGEFIAEVHDDYGYIYALNANDTTGKIVVNGGTFNFDPYVINDYGTSHYIITGAVYTNGKAGEDARWIVLQDDVTVPSGYTIVEPVSAS